MLRIWTQAKELANKTPPERNRYIDFIRALSILVVVTGHWLIAAFLYDDGRLAASDVLEIQPRTQWLTWLFQVMPMFFIVGGFSNAASLQSAKRHEMNYAGWLATRLHRLITPLLVLIIAWAILAAILHFAGVSGQLLQFGSRAALIPTWFLAIYTMVVVLAPATFEAWRRWGFASFWTLATLAIVVDIAFFAADLRWLGWANYFWVWLAVHQLGYAWHSGRTGGWARNAVNASLGFVVLVWLVREGPYPFAMVGSPDEDISNSMPPKVTLVVLGVIQFSLLLVFEKPIRRALAGLRIWAATVLINSMVMTLYLWHLTVMVIIVALSNVVGGFGLRIEPVSSEWWLTRPIWIAFLYAALLPVTLLLSPLERRARAADAAAPAAVRQVGGATLICAGVALLARFGFGSPPIPYLDIVAFLMVGFGAASSGLLRQLEFHAGAHK